MTKVTIDGRTYIMVRSISHGCNDCVAHKGGDIRCKELKLHAPQTESYWCTDVAWIEDTEKSRVAHALKVIEAS